MRPALADLEVLNQGMVLLLLPHFVASVFNAEPQCRRIMFDPDHRNAALREFCESGGCVFLGEHDQCGPATGALRIAPHVGRRAAPA